MSTHTHVDRPSLLIDFLEQESMLPGLDHKIVLPGEKLLPGCTTARCIEEWLRSFKKKRNGIRVISYLPVRKSVKIFRRELHPHFESFHIGEHHRCDHRKLLPFLVSDDRADNRILKFCLMQIDDDIHLFFSNHLHESVCGLFRQGAIRTAGPAPVKISYVDIGEFLKAGIMNIHLGIGPLIERVRPPVTESECLPS